MIQAIKYPVLKFIFLHNNSRASQISGWKSLTKSFTRYENAPGANGKIQKKGYAPEIIDPGAYRLRIVNVLSLICNRARFYNF